MRKQYYFLLSDRGLLAWDVDRLVDLSQGLRRKRVRLDTIRELDEPLRALRLEILALRHQLQPSTVPPTARAPDESR